MIKIKRISTPPIIVQNSAIWTEELCQARKEYYIELHKYQQGISKIKPKKPRADGDKYAHKQIRRYLENMFGSKCAYCESEVRSTSYQEVEHFRPQSIYPLLAYMWENFLLACKRCNAAYKSDKFPLDGNIQPVEDSINPCSLDDSDNCILVDPCSEDPTEFFAYYKWKVIGLNYRGDKTIEVLGLNREDLENDRRRIFSLFEMNIKAYLLAKELGAKDKEREFANTIKSVLPSSIYLAMLLSVMKDLGVSEEMLDISSEL